MTNPTNTPTPTNTVRNGLAGVAVTTAALVGGLTLLPSLAGAQETDPVTPDTEAPAEGTERRGHRGHRGSQGVGSEVLTDLLGLTQEEIREGLQAGSTLAELAEAQGVSTTDLVAALVAETEANIAEHVADGDITQEQADAKLDGLEERITEQVTSVHTGHAGRHGRGHGKSGVSSEALSEALGLSQDEIREGLQAGSTLAELGEAQGVSTDDLVAALVAQAQENVAEKVAAGDITQEEADAKLEQLTERTEDRVTSEPSASSGGRGHRGPRGGAPAETETSST